MRRKIVPILIASAIWLLTSSCATASHSTTVSVDPSTIEVSVGKAFTINITILNVADLYAWDLGLYYQNDVLNATDIVEGDFLKTAGETFWWIYDFNDAYNATHGRVSIICLLTGSTLGASGNGTLAAITFRPVHEGNTTINIYSATLLNSDGTTISHTKADGQVTVTGILLLGDLDGSGKVDWKDLLILARAYGSDPTKPNWNPIADIDGNGKVDWKDLLTLARNYGKTA